MEFKISSDEIGKITEALSKAQGQMEGAIKDSTNPHRKSKYADISSVLEALKKPLSDNGLSISCSIVIESGVNILIGTLSHVTGEWFRTYIPLISPQNDMQGLGASITYARRYAISALCGVSQVDDDGESIREEEKKPELITNLQVSKIKSLNPSDEEIKYICSFNKVEKIQDLSIIQGTSAISFLEKRRESK